MKQNLSVNLLVRLQVLDFTFDEVIIEFEQVFKEKGMPGILEVILEYVDGHLVKNISSAPKFILVGRSYSMTDKIKYSFRFSEH